MKRLFVFFLIFHITLPVISQVRRPTTIKKEQIEDAFVLNTGDEVIGNLGVSGIASFEILYGTAYASLPGAPLEGSIVRDASNTVWIYEEDGWAIVYPISIAGTGIIDVTYDDNAGVASWVIDATETQPIIEEPAEDPDGLIRSFTASEIFSPDTLSVFLNGVKQLEIADYIVNATNDGYTFQFAIWAEDTIQHQFIPAE
jgi:hypothetical protein